MAHLDGDLLRLLAEDRHLARAAAGCSRRSRSASAWRTSSALSAAGDREDGGVDVGILVVEEGALHAGGQQVAHVATFLRTWYHIPGTWRGGVVSRSSTCTTALPGRT